MPTYALRSVRSVNTSIIVSLLNQVPWGLSLAQDSFATVQWTPNTEPDLAGYVISTGYIYNGTFLQQAAVNAGNVSSRTFTAADGILGTPIFQRDGFVAFEVAAYDTSNNTSLPSTPAVEKYVVRTKGTFIRRK